MLRPTSGLPLESLARIVDNPVLSLPGVVKSTYDWSRDGAHDLHHLMERYPFENGLGHDLAPCLLSGFEIGARQARAPLFSSAAQRRRAAAWPASSASGKSSCATSVR